MSRRPTIPAWLSSVGLMLLTFVGLTSPARAQIVNNPPVPPINLTVFTERDFVSASGYNADDLVIVKVIHPDGTVRSTDPANPIVPQDDPRAAIGAPFAGIVDVNHPGANCWFGVTPDIRAGDVVEIDIVGGPRAGRADAITVDALTVGRPIQIAPDAIQVHFTGYSPAGAPLPLGGLGVRIITLGSNFDATGARLLRAKAPRPGAVPAAGEGVITQDAPGLGNFTATFSGLSPADMIRAMSSIMSADNLPGGLPTGTVYENGPGVGAGPAVSCSAPLEILPPLPGSEIVPPSTPAGLASTLSNFSNVTLSWAPSTDNVGVTSYGIYRNGTPIGVVQNPDYSAPAPTVFVDANVPPGTYLYTVDAADSVGNRSPQSVALQVVTLARPAAPVAVHEPPVGSIGIVAFPSRDFVSSFGWRADDQVNVELIRDGRVISTSNGLIPQAGPGALPGAIGFAGFVDVNHPGAGCWTGTTPEMRAGDVLRFTAYGPDGLVRTIEQTRVAGVSNQRAVVVQNDDPGTIVNEGVVEIHGTAIGADGQPIPADQLEHRVVTNSSLFDLSARRTLRTGAQREGILSYDVANNPLGYNWTATYMNLNGDDVARIVGGRSVTSGRTFVAGEVNILWLGQNPLTLNESTIYENSALNPPGAAAPSCTALLEAPDTSAPTAPGNLTGGVAGPHAFQLTWVPSTDDWSVAHYRIFRDGQPIGAAAGTSNTYLDANVPPGIHAYSVKAYDHASPLGAGLTNEQRIASAFGQPYGNASLASNEVVTNQPDVTAPTMPGAFQAITGPNLVGLSWTPSTDDVGVVSYRIYRDNVAIQDVAFPAVSHIDSLLATGTYTYAMDAADAAGNRSPRTAAVTVVVQARADITPPSVPTGLVASVSPDLHGRDVILTWNASIDPANGGVNSLVTGYGIYRDGLRIASVAAPALTFTDAAVPVGTHRYQVDAYDSPFNHSNTSAAVTAVIANSPPPRGHLLSAFPSRDYVSASGYPVAGNPYHFEVIRPGATFVSDTISVRANDPTGLVEVNHPGGTCWLVTTPDIVPGDIVRIVDAHGIADQTYVAEVYTGRPIATGPNSFVVHGTARTLTGAVMPIGQVGHLMVLDQASGLLDRNNGRTIRAGSAGIDGILAYDAPGSPNWTATYTGLSSTDMLRIMGGTDPSGRVYVPAESQGQWAGRVPIAATEIQFMEMGPIVPGGPAPACVAPLQIPVPAATLLPGLLTFPATTTVSGALSAELRNVGGAPMVVRNVYLSGMNPTDYTITAGAGPRTLAAGGRLTISVAFAPKALGLRQAFLSVDCNAANTQDLSIPLSGVGIGAQAPPAPGTPVASFAAGTQLSVAAGGAIANSLMPVRVNWAPAVSPLVTSYQLQMSVNSAPWVDTPNQPGAATSIVLGLPMGTAAAPKTYQFRVRAMNITVPGAWSTAARVGFTMVDNQSTSISYSGNWALTADVAAYGGSTRNSSAVKTATTLLGKTRFTIPGSIAWVATMGPDRGLVSVSVDKGAPVTVDLYSPTLQKAMVPFAVNVGAGAAHTITINVLGTRNASSAGTKVESDLFVIMDGAAGTTPAELQQADDTEFDSTPKALAFAPISPNPSRGEAMLSFALPRDGHVEMGIVDIAGRQVRSLHSGAMNAGSHNLVWDGRTSAGQSSAPGIYFAVLRFEDRTMTKRIVRIP